MLTLTVVGVFAALAAILGVIVAVRNRSLWRHGKSVCIAGAVLVACYALLHRPLGCAMGNLWGLLTDRLYLIPTESSLWSFRVSKMNPGSGDWWIYGEDAKNYYFFEEEPETAYTLFPKSRVAQCSGFHPQDVSTWCPEYRVNRDTSDSR